MKNIQTIIYVIDDDEAICDSLKWLLESWGYKIKTCSSIQSFFANYDTKYLAVLLVDVRLGNENGMSILGKLDKKKIKIPLAFITGHGDIPMAVYSMQKGAIDFIQKPFDNVTIKNIIEKLIFLAPQYHKNQENIKILFDLTIREKQILNGVINSRLNKQIASDLNISIKTVEAHRANIMNKLKAKHVTKLVKIVLKNAEELELIGINAADIDSDSDFDTDDNKKKYIY